MADEQELTGSQVAGAIIGGLAGFSKGGGIGTTLALATAPVLGPFAVVFLPLGMWGGMCVGAKVGSKGLGRAALMAGGVFGGDLLPDVVPSDTDTCGGGSKTT